MREWGSNVSRKEADRRNTLILAIENAIHTSVRIDRNKPFPLAEQTGIGRRHTVFTSRPPGTFIVYERPVPEGIGTYRNIIAHIRRPR